MSVPKTQLAAASSVATQTHSIKELPVAPPGDDEVLIRIEYAAINPVDWKIVNQVVPIPAEEGRVLGQDGSGKVVAVGSGVDQLKAGDNVLFQAVWNNPKTSTFQQYATVPARFVVKTPIGLAESATIPLGTMTPLIALYHASGLGVTPAPWAPGGGEAGKGKSIFIVGAGASVGQYGVQLAKLSGYSSIITTSSPTHFDLLKSFGATHTLDRSSATIADVIAAAGAHPLEHIYDAIGLADTGAFAVETLQASLKTFPNISKATDLVIASVGRASEEVKATASASTPPIDYRNIYGSASLPPNEPVSVPFLRALEGPAGYLATGGIIPNKVRIVPGGLNSVDEALRINREGVSGVKVVINISETKA